MEYSGIKICNQAGKWINAAVVFNVETATMYIDGKVDCKKESLFPAFNYDTGRMFLVGAKRDNATDSLTDYFAGYISQCDVWERALSDEEVQAYINREPDVDAENGGLHWILTMMAVSML